LRLPPTAAEAHRGRTTPHTARAQQVSIMGGAAAADGMEHQFLKV
jgi:hypothetical protein